MSKQSPNLPISSLQSPKKIMMIAPTSFFGDYGGHIRIYEETLALQALGHEIIIVTYYKGRDLDGIDIRRTAPLPYRAEYEVGSSRHKYAFDVYLAFKSLQVAFKERPDIIHGHMHEGALIGGVLSKLLRVPLVFDFQGSLTAEMLDHNFMRRDGKTHAFWNFIETTICKFPQAILTSSRKSHRMLKEQFHVPEEKLFSLPDCADVDRFDPTLFSEQEKAALKEQFNIPADRTLVVYLGLLTDYQGIPDLLQTAKKLKDRNANIHFLIMGFPSVGYYKNMAEELETADYVTFTGKVGYDRAPKYLSIGDIAVSAKVSSTEGSGKLLNYMSLGIPVVAYDTTVHREYLGPHGIYVPVRDIDAFADAFEMLAKNPEKRQQLSKSLRQRLLDGFTWEEAAKLIDSLYSRLTS